MRKTHEKVLMIFSSAICLLIALKLGWSEVSTSGSLPEINGVMSTIQNITVIGFLVCAGQSAVQAWRKTRPDKEKARSTDSGSSDF